MDEEKDSHYYKRKIEYRFQIMRKALREMETNFLADPTLENYEITKKCCDGVIYAHMLMVDQEPDDYTNEIDDLLNNDGDD